ncbi:MAG: 16S rRNA (adenine(1518)-N(6)/adenine(1519)-N(6))-dimethyltransferase RsmA [Bacteroidales bacterium]|nr:16S rRNA (adenine(1518)-N(6)/adenine(1519)-N(6))-dimethyltransferase RsmA [Bacteroidales bacterium]
MKPETVKAKKRLGQHFLTDLSIAQAIADALPPHTRRVLEVGPGMGVLTRFLLQHPEWEVHAVELDEESVRYLHRHFPELQDRLHAMDFLKADLPVLLPAPFAVIGNFPYNISSQILFRILDHKDLIPDVVGMFQKEVAVRIASGPGNKDYGILSVLLQAFYDIEYLFTVSEQVFDPPPKVKSAVIRLRRNSRSSLPCDEALWKRVVKTAFNQRRKTLHNSLKSFAFPESVQADPIFRKRPEALSVEDFVWLTQQVMDEKPESW